MVWAQNEGVRRLDFVKGGDTRGGSFSVEGDLRDNNAGERRAQSCIWSEIIDDADRAFVSCDEGGRTGAPFDALINGLGGTSGNVREGPEILGEATVCYSLSGNLFGSGEVCVGKESALMLSFSSSSNQRGNLNQNLIARCLTADAPDLVLTPLSSRFEDVLPVARLDLPPLDCR